MGTKHSSTFLMYPWIDAGMQCPVQTKGPSNVWAWRITASVRSRARTLKRTTLAGMALASQTCSSPSLIMSTRNYWWLQELAVDRGAFVIGEVFLAGALMHILCETGGYETLNRSRSTKCVPRTIFSFCNHFLLRLENGICLHLGFLRG